jgi:hypothetical protein
MLLSPLLNLRVSSRSLVRCQFSLPARYVLAGQYLNLFATNDSQNIPSDIKWEPNTVPPQYTDHADQVIEKGTSLRLKILGVKPDVAAINAIGTIKEDYLGWVCICHRLMSLWLLIVLSTELFEQTFRLDLESQKDLTAWQRFARGDIEEFSHNASLRASFKTEIPTIPGNGVRIP